MDLKKICEKIKNVQGVFKSETKFGDLLVVFTENSTYYMTVLGKKSNLIFGGWFDRKGLSPTVTSVNGCTWGSHIICANILAACGLYLEFRNGVITSEITKVIILHSCGLN
jgi:hypothetical protein